MSHDELGLVLASLAGVVDGDEPVDELSHALQCARLAELAGASPELVAAALFHDVARSPLVAGDEPAVAHEVAGARWLAPRFGEHVAWLVGAHVAAKLHLIEHEAGYLERLSEESVRSAVRQAGTSNTAFHLHRWWPEAVQLRRWDDAAKKRDAQLVEPEELLRLVRPLGGR